MCYREKTLCSLKEICSNNLTFNDFEGQIQATFINTAARKLKGEVAFHRQICFPSHPNLTNIQNQGVHQGCVPPGQRMVPATNITEYWGYRHQTTVEGWQILKFRALPFRCYSTQGNEHNEKSNQRPSLVVEYITQKVLRVKQHP